MSSHYSVWTMFEHGPLGWRRIAERRARVPELERPPGVFDWLKAPAPERAPRRYVWTWTLIDRDPSGRAPHWLGHADTNFPARRAVDLSNEPGGLRWPQYTPRTNTAELFVEVPA